MPTETSEEVEAPEIKRVEVDTTALTKFRSESDFMSLAVDLMVEVGSYSCLAACTLGTKKTWDRDLAAIGGNMVRLYKLLDALLDQTCKHRRETSFMLGRLVFEAAVNIRFLIQNFSKDLIDSYVQYSLRHERRLRDRINCNIQARSGVVIPIEDRMLKSIERTAKASGISLDDIDLGDRRPWGGKNIFERAASVGLEDAYLAAFGGMSHGIHGNWQEIYGHHLDWEEGGEFRPHTHWREPRPQILFALGLIVIDTIDLYFPFIGGKEVGEHFNSLLTDLKERVVAANDAHERYLSGKQWPET